MKSDKEILDGIFQKCAELIYEEMLEPLGW